MLRPRVTLSVHSLLDKTGVTVKDREQPTVGEWLPRFQATKWLFASGAAVLYAAYSAIKGEWDIAIPVLVFAALLLLIGLFWEPLIRALFPRSYGSHGRASEDAGKKSD